MSQKIKGICQYYIYNSLFVQVVVNLIIRLYYKYYFCRTLSFLNNAHKAYNIQLEVFNLYYSM